MEYKTLQLSNFVDCCLTSPACWIELRSGTGGNLMAGSLDQECGHTQGSPELYQYLEVSQIIKAQHSSVGFCILREGCG